MPPKYSTIGSSRFSGTMLDVVPKKRSSEKKELPKGSPAMQDTSLHNPTPAMLAILARMRSKEENTAAAVPSKRKEARFDSRSSSPKAKSAKSAACGDQFPFPSYTPRNLNLYVTIDCTPEEERRGKKISGSGGSQASSILRFPRTQVNRKKHQESVILDDGTASSVNSRTAGESSTPVTPDNNKRRVVFTKLPNDSPAKQDTSLHNPTLAMLAILARMRSKEETAAATVSLKRKQARLDSRSCNPIDLDSSSILTPAMEEIIRLREVRKSMKHSGHFFTPICSPMTESANSATSGGHFPFPSSTPRNLDLYMTLDCTPEEEPRRKKSMGSGGGQASSTRRSPRTQVNRNKHQESVILDDTTASSVDSSTAGESSTSVTPDNNKRRVVFTSHGLLSKVTATQRTSEPIERTTVATQATSGVLKLPTLHRYALRSAQSPLSTPGGLHPPSQVIERSPDTFRDGRPRFMEYFSSTSSH